MTELLVGLLAGTAIILVSERAATRYLRARRLKRGVSEEPPRFPNV